MKYKINFSYDGTNYYGYAKQVDKITIQEEIETKLSKILNTAIKIYASGRTDKKVHAVEQVADFSIDKEVDCNKLKIQLNKLLNTDIHINYIQKVSDNFSSRFSVKKKTYIYIINPAEPTPFLRNYEFINPAEPTPFLRNYEFFENRIDLNKIKECLSLFKGKHNFQNFTSKESDENNFIRTIYDFKILVRNGKYIFKITGNGFMKYMVRKIIGVLIEIGKGNLTKEFIKENLDVTSRNIVTYTAEPQGLYLFKIYY